MAMLGLDPDVIEGVGNQLKQLSSQIGTIISSVENQVNTAQGAWKGNDATQFLEWWTGQHKPALSNAMQAIEGLGQSAMNNAAEQRQVSGQ